MTTAYTSLLGLALPVTGELSGTWGDTVNNYITQYTDASVAGTQTISGTQTAVTLSVANGTSLSQAGSGSTGSSQYQIINCTGSPASTLTITAPASSKSYIILNATSTSQSVKIVGVGPTTGVTVVSGEKAVVAWNGSDFVKVSTSTAGSGSVTSVAQTFTGGIISVAGSPITSSGTLALTVAGTSGGIPYFSNGTTWASSAALAANALVIGGGAGASPATTTTGTGVLTALGINVGSSGAFTTNNAANTFTALQTFSGSTSVAASKFTNAKEVATVSATAATGTINYDVTTQSVLYYTTNASANWTVNFRGSSGTSLDTLMSTGESMTVAFLVTQGSTAYYNSAVQVDGSAVTPKYQGGTAWSAGNASSIDAYVYTIVKTGSATFTVFASQTQFK